MMHHTLHKAYKQVAHLFILSILILTGCGDKIVDTSNVEELVKAYHEALSEGDADLLKQTRHIKFIRMRDLQKFESGNLFDEDGRRSTFSNVQVIGEPKTFTSTQSEFKYKVFDYVARGGMKFESQKAYHKFLKEIYPLLRDDPDIDGLKAEGWVKGVTIRRKLRGMSFWDQESKQWYFCDVDRYDLYKLKDLITDQEYRAVRSKLNQ